MNEISGSNSISVVFEKYENVCNICKKTFSKKHSLCKHERLIHKILTTKIGTFCCLENRCECTFATVDEIRNHIAEEHAIPKMPVKTCVICEKTFSKKYNLYKHLRMVHKIETRTGTLFCPKSGCEFTFPNLAGIRTHLAEIHQARNVLERREMAFQIADDFYAWKRDEEKDSNSSFVSQRKPKIIARSDVKKQIYYCNRSGKCTLAGSGQVRMKSQGSCKTGKCCPAAMEVEWFPDGSVKLLYWSGHFGHRNDVAHVRLSHAERAEIADKLAQGVSFDTVLDEVRSSATGPLKRIHLLRRHDLHNIRKSFDLREKKCHDNDAASVALWVKGLEKLSESPVLLYKAQGVQGGYNMALFEDDFMLILMSSAQADMLKWFGVDRICVDSSYGAYETDVHLTTLLVIDECGAGFPIAFCVSNKINAIHMQQFFMAIKEKVGNVKACVFLSYYTPLYYDAWKVVMGEAENNLICPWHVNEHWRQKIHEKVTGGKDVEDRVFDRLRALVETSDQKCLELLVPDYIDFLMSDETTQAFGMFFQETYASCVQSWSFCSLAQAGIQTNVQLESMHQVLQDIFSEGKKAERLDACLTALMQFSRDQTSEQMMRLCEHSSNKTVQEINQQHHKSLDIDSADVQLFEEGWKVTSQSDRNVSYLVSKVEDICPNNCQVMCEDCHVCIHMYTCTCSDAMVHCTVCKHVHAVIRNYGHQEGIEMATAIATINEEMNALNNSLNTSNQINSENVDHSIKGTFNCCLELIESGTVDDTEKLQLDVLLKNWLEDVQLKQSSLSMEVKMEPDNKKNEDLR